MPVREREGRKMTKSQSLIAATAIASTMMCGAAAAQQPQPASLTDANLAGKWVVNLGKCSDANAEFITFGGNGAVESMRDGRADAVGFWRLDNDRILLTVLAPPGRFDEKLKDVKGYYAFDILIATFNVTADGFEGVGLLGEQVRYGKFTRCKA